MSLKVEDIKTTIKVSDEIIQELKDSLYSGQEDLEDLEDFYFKVDDKPFALIKIISDDWIDDGKYDYCANKYQLVSYDEDIAVYPYEASITEYYNTIVEQEVSRTGSYYTEWTYIYDKPTIHKAYLENVPEVVIPEHEEVRYKEI